MSIGTIVGFITGFVLFIYAIIQGGASNPWVFIHPNSFLMVIGGTIAATFIAYKEIYVIQALSGMIDTDRDTYILTERLPGNPDEDKIWYYTAGVVRGVVYFGLITGRLLFLCFIGLV